MRARTVVIAGTLVALLVCAVAAPRLGAQCPTSFMFTSSTQFGQALDVSGDRLILGDGSMGAGGTAVVMRRAEWGWVAEDSILSSAPQLNGRFGEAVAIAGDWAAVGAPGELGAAGAVHVFHRVCEPGLPCQWQWIARLQPAEPAANDRFGAAVALDGARLLVSAPYSDVAAPDSGALFVFELIDGTWTQVQTLTAGAGATANAGLGACVALAGDIALAGSKSAERAWLFESAAGVFGEAALLAVPDAGNFGAAVATDGTRVLIGSPGSNATMIKSGAAHVFERTGPGAWMLAATLKPPGSALFAAFGSSVALDGATAAVGAPGSGAGHGALHVLHNEPAGWLLAATFDALPGPQALGLGVASALEADTLLCGARAAFGPPGVVYTFGGVAPWTQLGGGLAGSAGMPVLATDGSLCSGDTLTLLLSQAKPKAAALFVIGLQELPQAWKGGVLWPSPDLVVPVVVSTAGKASLTLHVPTDQGTGQPVLAQAWVVDATAPAGLSASPGIRAETP